MFEYTEFQGFWLSTGPHILFYSSISVHPDSGYTK